MNKLLLLTTIFVGAQASASAWLLPLDRFQLIVQYRYQSRPGASLNEISAFGQYGLFEKATVGALFSQSMDSTANLVGQTGSQGLFFTPLLWKGTNGVMSIQFTMGMATFKNAVQSSSTAGFNEIRFQEGYSAESFFVDVQLAQKTYAGGFDAETKLDNALGFRFSPSQEIYFQNFNTWTKSYRSHEMQVAFSSPLRNNSPHILFGGISVPWGSTGISTGLIFSLGYRCDL